MGITRGDSMHFRESSVLPDWYQNSERPGNPNLEKKITFLSPIGIPQGPTIPIKKVYIPVFHAGGHCGLRFSHFIDFLTIF